MSARGPYFVDDAPEIEMLQRALGEVLPLGDLLQPGAALHERARHASQAELHGERDAHRASAHDDNLDLGRLTALSHITNRI